jgi:hypothetical protein
MLHRRQRQRRTADLAELLAATGGLLARGRSGEYRRLECKAISRVLYSPLLLASPESLPYSVVVEPGVLEELAPPGVVAGPPP